MTALNTYEVLIIFKPILDVENVDAVASHFQKNIVEANGGQILDADRIGRKRMAFEVRKFKDGFLTLYILKLPAEKVADFKRACQLNEDILRLTLVRQPEGYVRENFRDEGRRDEGRRNDRGGFRGGPPGGGFRGNDRDGGDRGGGGFRREGGPPPRRDGEGMPPRRDGEGMPPRREHQADVR